MWFFCCFCDSSVVSEALFLFLILFSCFFMINSMFMGFLSRFVIFVLFCYSRLVLCCFVNHVCSIIPAVLFSWSPVLFLWCLSCFSYACLFFFWDFCLFSWFLPYLFLRFLTSFCEFFYFCLLSLFLLLLFFSCFCVFLLFLCFMSCFCYSCLLFVIFV